MFCLLYQKFALPPYGALRHLSLSLHLSFRISLYFFLRLSRIMSKRHNRKRTRSRPRHRDGGKAQPNHARTLSVDTISSHSTANSSFQPLSFPLINHSPDWHQTYTTWQTRQQLQQEQAMEAQRLRFFGGEVGEEVSLLEPMLKVVMDLFDGDIDYQDP